MAQYEKLINLSLLNQFLTKAKTIFAPKITASGILKGDGAGNVSAATAGTDYATPALVKVSDTQPTESENKLWVDTDGGSGNSYQIPTVAESLAMGVSGAKVGDLVRVNSVDSNGKPTSWKHVPLNEIKCNKNLLDNWYFVGGGSQLGDGVFPINQIGQTIYSGAGYGIDRWRTWEGTDSLTLDSDGLSFISPLGGGLVQYFTQPIFQDGDTITISAIIDGNLYTASGEKENGGIDLTDSTNTVRYFEGNNKSFRIKSDTSGKKIKAVKLELGSEQTLAHNEGTKENPVWVLNEIPNYATELIKCQRFLFNINPNGLEYATCGFAYAAGTNNINVIVSLPTTFTPTTLANVPIVKNTISFQVGTRFYTASNPIIKIYNISSGSCQLNISGFSGLTIGSSGICFFSDHGTIVFSCEP